MQSHSPWASWLNDGNPFAPTATKLLPTGADGSAGTPGDPGSVVAVTSGGITINVIYDTAALAAPASFRAGIQQALAIMASAISDKITVNIKIDRDGGVVVYTGASDIGQGSDTMIAQIVAEVLGCKLQRVKVIAADTDLTPALLKEWRDH